MSGLCILFPISLLNSEVLFLPMVCQEHVIYCMAKGNEISFWNINLDVTDLLLCEFYEAATILLSCICISLYYFATTLIKVNYVFACMHANYSTEKWFVAYEPLACTFRKQIFFKRKEKKLNFTRTFDW